VNANLRDSVSEDKRGSWVVGLVAIGHSGSVTDLQALWHHALKFWLEKGLNNHFKRYREKNIQLEGKSEEERGKAIDPPIRALNCPQFTYRFVQEMLACPVLVMLRRCKTPAKCGENPHINPCCNNSRTMGSSIFVNYSGTNKAQTRADTVCAHLKNSPPPQTLKILCIAQLWI